MSRGWTKTLGNWAKRPASELNAAAVALVADAKAAARLREHRSDPNVAALTIERTRDRLDRAGWTGLFAALSFTTVNVQAFVAGNAPEWTLPWIVAWLIEPMVMGIMLVLLRGEQIANRYGEQVGAWVKWTKWVALLITYVMNTSAAWVVLDPRTIFIHSIPVLLVFLSAEALVNQRLILTKVVEGLWRPKVAQSAPDRPMVAQTVLERPTPSQTVTNVRVDAEPVDTVKVPVEEVEPLADELVEPRSKKEQGYLAFRELVIRGRGIDEIGPAEVDRRAGIRPGSSKVPGRMAEYRVRYVKEAADGEVAS